MRLYLVEPKNNKFSAYHFDGSEKSAKQVVEKWGGTMSKIDNNINSQYNILLNNGSEILPDSYIILENKSMLVYTHSEFIEKYNIVYDGDRYSLCNFMSDY
jgi:hypothetical protein